MSESTLQDAITHAALLERGGVALGNLCNNGDLILLLDRERRRLEAELKEEQEKSLRLGIALDQAEDELYHS